jgi:hypothetical protein
VRESGILEAIVAAKSSSTQLKVVAIEVEFFGRRRTSRQSSVIRALTTCIWSALLDTEKSYLFFPQVSRINFRDNLILMHSGHGCAVGFVFRAIHDIHFQFARNMIARIPNTDAASCDRFAQDGWCNCHDYFRLRIGVSDELGVIYKNLNSEYSMAGRAPELAMSAMKESNENRIVFTNAAYSKLIDAVGDPNFDLRFHALEAGAGLEEQCPALREFVEE